MGLPARRSVWPIVVGGLVLLPVLYVLSLGPLIWLDRQLNFSRSVVELIDSMYLPVIWLQETGGPHRQILDWYFDLFSR